MNRKISGRVPRNQRMNSEIQKDIYEIIRNKLKNPLITEMFSVTDVNVSRDLSHADVFISVYSKNESKAEQTFNAINNDAKKIRFELAKISRARTVPELRFIMDGSMEYGDKMDKLFMQIKKGDESEQSF